MAFGLVPGNHVIERPDHEIAESVNISLERVVYHLNKRESTLTTGRGYIPPVTESPFKSLGELLKR